MWLRATMRFFLLTGIAGGIIGCTSLPFEAPAPESAGESGEVDAGEGAAGDHRPKGASVKNSGTLDKSEEAVFSELGSLLVYRERACSLPEESREQLLRGYQELETPTTVMATLMLASCAPDRTPGLLANTLVAARDLEHTTPGFDGLLSLLEAQLRSYSLIETELKNTRGRLEEMINGLRQIEAEMGQDARGQE